jgi:hypothetical protein
MRPLPLLAACLALTSAALAQAPASVLGQNPTESYRLSVGGGAMANLQRVPASHPAFSEALRVTVDRIGSGPHHVQLQNSNRATLSPGNVVLVRFYMRSGGEEGTRANAHLFIQKASGYARIADLKAEAGTQWTLFTLPVTFTEEFFRNEVLFNIFLGSQPQIVEIGGIQALDLGPNPTPEQLRRAAMPPPQIIDFEDAFQPIEPVAGSRASISGSLPPQISEDSSWANVEVRYSRASATPFSGSASLEAQVSAVRNGAVQLAWRNRNLDPTKLVRIGAALRSSTNTPVRVQLRQSTAPFRVYWETTYAAVPEWGRFESIAPVAISDPDAMLLFVIDRPGRVEFDELSFAYLDPRDAVGASREGNLLPHSSFPLGLVTPWSAGGNHRNPDTYTADSSEPGPATGLPSLRINPVLGAGRPHSGITAAFEGVPGAKHTLSFWGRTDRPGQLLHMRMGPPDQNLWVGQWQQNVNLSGQWRRYSFTVELPFAASGHHIARLVSHEEGVFWIDGISVTLGEQPPESPLSGKVELALATPDWYSLTLDEAPATFRLALWGDQSAASEIRMRVRDLNGTEHPLPSVPVSQLRRTGAFSIVDLELPLDGPWPRFGSHIIEALAVDASGNAVSQPAEIALHRVRSPRALGRNAPESHFGTHVFLNEDEVRTAKYLGFNWLRSIYIFSWSRVEPRAGEWNWERLDAEVDVLRRHNMEMLGYFGGVPRRHSVARDDWTNSWWRTTAIPRADAMDAFEEYAFRLASRYSDVIHAWEAWNEPFLPGFFPADVVDGRPVRGEPAKNVEITRRARAALERIGPNRPLLLWNNGFHYPAGPDFDRESVNLGILNYVDKATFHQYTFSPLGFPGDEVRRVAAIQREELGKANYTGELWNSEGGKGPADRINLLRHAPPLDRWEHRHQAADHLVRYYVSSIAGGVDKFFCYFFSPEDHWRNGYSYLTVDGRLGASAPAISNLAWHIEGKKFEGHIALQDDVHAYLFADNRDAVAVLIPTSHRRLTLASLPDGVILRDLYGNDLPRDSAIGGNTAFLFAPGSDASNLRKLLLPHISR